MECNFFQKHKKLPGHAEQQQQQHRLQNSGHSRGHSEHHHNTVYASNITMVSIAPEETTSFAEFDSTRKVLSLNPKELDCEEESNNKLMQTSTIVSIVTQRQQQTQQPLVMEDSDETVMTKTKAHSNNNKQVEHNVLADTPDLNPSQSSHSSSRQQSSSSSSDDGKGKGSSTSYTASFTMVSFIVTALIIAPFSHSS